MLRDKPLTVQTLLRTFLKPISITWLLTLCETALMALIPLFIGFAIDGLLEQNYDSLYWLTSVLSGLILLGMARRIYDTRIYGTIRAALGRELIDRSGALPVSRQNARLDMGRELVDFLEAEVPNLLTSSVQLVISVVILFLFHPTLAWAALAAAMLTITTYGASHKTFFRLNTHFNHQMEKQVNILSGKSPDSVFSHLQKLRHTEVRLSDMEAYVYGAIYAILMAFIIFNVWFATTNLTATVGTIFSIISYSWEFVEATLILPVTLQGWTRLSEIMERINQPNAG